MRVSKYFIHVPLSPEESLLVHGYTGAVDLVTPNVVKFLKDFKPKKNSGLISQETSELLKERGYLTEWSSKEEEEYVIKLGNLLWKRAVKKAQPGFLIVPTYNCNFRCVYCYEARIRTQGLQWLETTMDKNMVDSTFKTMEELEAKYNQNNGIPHEVQREGNPSTQSQGKSITLYGGEPLLGINRPLIECIVNKGIASGYRFRTITNGADLDQFLDLLGPGKIEWAQVTLDGPPKIHDQRRFFKDRTGSFNKIVDNISLALETGLKISVRINTDRSTVDSLEELQTIIRERGWNKNKNFSAYTSPVHRSGRPLKKTDLTHKELWSLQMNKLQGDKKIGYSNFGIINMFKRFLRHRSYMPFKTIFCGSNIGMYLFDPFGNIYSCWEAVGDERHRIGSYVPDLLIDEEAHKGYLTRTVFNIPQCKSCKYALFCGGGCTQFAYNRYGCYLSPYCQDYPYLFSKNVKISWYQYQKENKNRGKARPTPVLALPSSVPMVPNSPDINHRDLITCNGLSR